MTEKKYPVSEIFTSPQGEGLFTGTLMTFVRLAGCSVGKPYTVQNRPVGLPIYTEQCKTYDGRTFDCDTDFRVKERLTADEILSRVPDGVEHICISGGEPLIHDLLPLVEAIGKDLDIMPHLETSGTIFNDDVFDYFGRTHVVGNPAENETLWITVSPKFGCLPECISGADEIKLLVDKDFDLEIAKDLVGTHDWVYIQPVNLENMLDYSNVQKCLEVQKQMPQWRISLQMHKILNVR